MYRTCLLLIYVHLPLDVGSSCLLELCYKQVKLLVVKKWLLGKKALRLYSIKIISLLGRCHSFMLVSRVLFKDSSYILSSKICSAKKFLLNSNKKLYTGHLVHLQYPLKTINNMVLHLRLVSYRVWQLF